MDSHAVGARLTVKNTGAALELGFDLVGFAAAQGQEMKLSRLPLTAGGQPLAFGKVGNLNPVVILENGRASADSSQFGRYSLQNPGQRSNRRALGSRGKTSASRVGGAGAEMAATGAGTRRCGASHRQRRPSRRSKRATRIPTPRLPSPINSWCSRSSSRPPACPLHPSWRHASRDRGYSPRGDGTDYPRGWSGQTPDAGVSLGAGARAD